MSSNLEAGAPVALITGGARGLGYATGESLVKRGYRVALVDIDGEGSQSAAERLSPQSAIGLQCDVASDNDVESTIVEIERRFGRLDTLVNNAGGVDPGRTQEVSTTSWTNDSASSMSPLRRWISASASRAGADSSRGDRCRSSR